MQYVRDLLTGPDGHVQRRLSVQVALRHVGSTLQEHLEQAILAYRQGNHWAGFGGSIKVKFYGFYGI